MFSIDISIKYAVVVPVKSNKEDDVAAGILECMHRMGKKPVITFTGDEGALHKPSLQT